MQAHAHLGRHPRRRGASRRGRRAPAPAPGLAEAWDSYIAALTLHEQGHVDRDVQSAQQLLDDLEALGEADCGSLATEVGALATKASIALAQANVDYDTQTSHGRTQGAVLAMP